jgi:hypothetical protein
MKLVLCIFVIAWISRLDKPKFLNAKFYYYVQQKIPIKAQVDGDWLRTHEQFEKRNLQQRQVWGSERR